jgi:hypothetical protein
MAKKPDKRPQDERDAEYIEDRLLFASNWVTGTELSYCTQKLSAHRRLRAIAYLIKMGRIQYDETRPESGKGPHVKRYRIEASDDIGLTPEEEADLAAFKKRYDDINKN